MLILITGTCCSAAWAQEVPEGEKEPGASRAALLREQRREKAEKLHPPKRNLVERLARYVERHQLVLDVPAVKLYGLRPVFGGLRSGSGKTAGLRFEPTEAEMPLLLSVEGLVSLRRYWALQGVAGYEDRPFLFYAFGRYQHVPEEPFYGIGPATRDHESNFRWDEALAGALVGVRVRPRLVAGAFGAYRANWLGPGSDDDVPTIGEVEPGTIGYDDIPAYIAASNRYVDVNYSLLGGFLEYDTRDIAYWVKYGSRFAPNQRGRSGLSLDARRGVYLAVRAIRYQPINGDRPFAFTRYELESQQFVSIRRGFEVLSLRQFLSLVDADNDDRVPFYEMEALGGGRVLRGFSTARFRDRNLALINAEFRWQVWTRMDMALFLDAGHVFTHANELSLGEMEAGYGVGFRYRTAQRVVGRLDVAYSREGIQLYLKLGSIL